LSSGGKIGIRKKLQAKSRCHPGRQQHHNLRRQDGMAEKNESLIVDATLDVRGESCPYPELYTLEAIEKLEDGKVLEVVADCPQSFINVPASCKRH
jgi:TusA-related sulfurtransferase